jgi:hypothetical protein
MRGEFAWMLTSLVIRELIANRGNLMPLNWSEKQAHYLAFIYNYTKIHGKSPTEAEMQRYFKVTPPRSHKRVESHQLPVFAKC